jgi:hypothetical protein
MVNLGPRQAGWIQTTSTRELALATVRCSVELIVRPMRMKFQRSCRGPTNQSAFD